MFEILASRKNNLKAALCLLELFVYIQLVKFTSKMTSRHRNKVEDITGKSFLFISLKEKLDLTLLRWKISVFYFSYKVSYFQRYLLM